MRNKAFTLVELLVVISLIVILTGIVMVSYRAGERQLILQRAASKLAQDIRRAQEMAMSAKELPPPGVGVPAGGYGICFDKSQTESYQIYADTTSPVERCDPGDQIIETIVLEREVKIKEVKVDSVVPDKVSINFKPPDPTIKLRDGLGVDYSATIITLALKSDDTKTKTIKVNKAGRIDID